MKDIKSLYLNARLSNREADIIAYQEAVNDAFNNDPSKYVLQLEYIISSSVGIGTVIPFIEKYGLPISLFEKAEECVAKCKKKLEDRKEDTAEYVKVENYLNSFHEKYAKCFAMNDYLIESRNHDYINAYYSTTNGKPNRMLIKGMYEKYGMESVMDSIITADQLGKNAVNTAINYFTKVNQDRMFNEALAVAVNGLDVDTQYVESAYNNSMTPIVNKVLQRNRNIFRESVITGNDDMMYEYSEDEINVIKDMIEFKEYCICAADELGISINECQSEIMSLYEELDGLIDEDGADLVEMLPLQGMQYAKENIFKPGGSWIANTRDKKTGAAPTYLSQNHDMINYGEDDGKPKSDEEDETKEKSLDDYKRPSSLGSKPSTSSYTDDEEDTNEEDNKKGSTSTAQPVSQNYYYYTYNNSMNKNSNSFNKDSSSHDDHSTHNRSDNHSTRDNHSTTYNDDHSRHSKSDDHSTNKRINSNDYNNADDEDIDNDGKPYEKLENSDPWSLDIFTGPELITEANEDMVGSADDDKPKSDHPIKDALTDFDRKTVKVQQGAKKVVQDVQNVGRAALKPVKRTTNWIGKMIGDYKDANENNIKEKLADPHSRKNVYTAVKKAVTAGALYKAGILLNPVFLFLAVTQKISNNQKVGRIRNEMIGEIKQEIAIIDEKIKDADSGMRDDPEAKAAKYKLMRLKNELEKKLLRVGGGKQWAKII